MLHIVYRGMGNIGQDCRYKLPHQRLYGLKNPTKPLPTIHKIIFFLSIDLETHFFRLVFGITLVHKLLKSLPHCHASPHYFALYFSISSFLGTGFA